MVSYKYFLLLLTALIICLCSNAQKQSIASVKGNRVLLSVNNGIGIESVNAVNDGNYPDPIKVPSKLSYKPGIALEFQRTTSYGLTFGVGLELGTYSQNFDVDYGTFYILDSTHVFKESSARVSYRNRTLYTGFRFTVGYTRLMPLTGPGYSWEARLGASKRYFFSGDKLERNDISFFTANNAGVSNQHISSSVYGSWGKYGMGYAPVVFDGYIGLRRDLDAQGRICLNLGLFGTVQYEYLTGVHTQEAWVTSGISQNGTASYGNSDYYTNRELVFGIKAGVGLKL